MSQAWDQFLAGEQRAPREAGDDFAAIDHLHTLDDVPALDSTLESRIWRDAVAIAGIAHTAPLPPVAAAGHNGHNTFIPASIGPAGTSFEPRRRPISIPRWDVARWLSGFVRILAIGTVAGMVAGAVSGGIVGRLAMRLVALMAEPWQQGMATDNGNAVGEITFSGSLGLLVLTALIGIAGGMLYVILRPWLPGTGLVRGAVFGGLLLLSSGWLIMDPDNPDYRRFGDTEVNVLLFSAIYIVFGLIVAPLADRLDRRIPAPWPVRSHRLPIVLGSAVLVLLALPSLIVGIGFLASPSGLLVGVLVLGMRAIVPRWAGKFERPADLLLRPRVAVAAYAAVAIPVLIGATLTLRAIGEILGSG